MIFELGSHTMEFHPYGWKVLLAMQTWICLLMWQVWLAMVLIFNLSSLSSFSSHPVHRGHRLQLTGLTSWFPWHLLFAGGLPVWDAVTGVRGRAIPLMSSLCHLHVVAASESMPRASSFGRDIGYPVMRLPNWPSRVY